MQRSTRAHDDGDRLLVQKLVDRYQDGDIRARGELVRHLLPLAKGLAARYGRGGESQEDLEQVACVGLIKAIDRYDPELGSLDRYAVPTILGELKRHFRDKGWGMRRLSRHSRQARPTRSSPWSGAARAGALPRRSHRHLQWPPACRSG